MTVLDRYVIRGFFYAFTLAMGVMVGLIIAVDLMVNFDEFVEVDIPLTQVAVDVVEYYGYQFFQYFSHLAGLMALIAATFTVGRMVRANELTALMASGVPMQRVLLPVGFCAAVVAGLWVANAELVVPSIADKLTRTHDDLATDGRVVELSFLREVPDPTRPDDDLLLSAKAFLPFRQPPVIRGLTLMSREGKQAGWTLQADRAWWDASAGAWRLQRGIRSRPPQAQGAVDDLRQTDLAGVREEVLELRTSLSPSELMFRQHARWIRFLSFEQLNRQATRTDLSESAKRNVALNRHARMTEPMVGLLTAVIGAAFFLRRGPVSLVSQTTQCLITCAIIFAAQFAFRLAPFGDPVLVAWLPLFLVATVAGWVYGAIKS